MRVEKTRKLKPLDRFLYWIKERHQIYERRKAGMERPWTDDKVMQTIFFTNPYRENDKTTVWFRDNIRERMKSIPDVLFATVCFRWFNKIETGNLLMRSNGSRSMGLLTTWNEKKAVALLKTRTDKNLPVFTGAFMIKVGNGPPGCKVPQVCECLTEVWDQRARLVELCQNSCSMQTVCERLTTFRGLGGFLSYEIVCDLRYTDLLKRAVDKDTWCNPGPGCSRGLNRLNSIPIVKAKGGMKDSGRKPPDDWQEQMVKLLAVVRKKLPDMPKFEMREIEHSLCEYDKYERMLFGEGKSKRKYNGAGE